MTNRPNRERWLHDVDARQRNVVFPDTVQNEGRFWRNLGNQGWTTAIKIGMFVLGIVVFARLAMFVIMFFGKGSNIWLLAVAVVFWGAIFGLIAWATRRALRRIEDARRTKDIQALSGSPVRVGERAPSLPG
ncbi:MAG: hypothetical protein WBQ08_09480 [Candidatus Sulfotelmatobacter sp.]